MKHGLDPPINAELARALLPLVSTSPEPGAEPLVHLLRGYRDNLYGQMLVAPDDQLAGFRGMLLALNNLLSALTRSELTKTIAKEQRK